MNKWYITLAASKPVRFRFKLWCLCSSDGYLFYSTPYGVAQNQTHSNLALAKPVNHQIFFDNFFHHSNSSYILQNNGYFVTVQSEKIEQINVQWKIVNYSKIYLHLP
nr:unnamed protein product [Callosobruchus chinensis]